jgi:hypothetical protein
MAKNGTPKELLQSLNLIRGTKGPKPESLDALESRQVERVRTIFEDRNIVAIGIAEKRTEKKKTGERPETALGPWVTPFYRLPRDRCVPFCLTPVIGRIRSLFK